MRREFSCLGENDLSHKFMYFICLYLSGTSISVERIIFPGLSEVMKHVKRFRIILSIQKV